jgi:hypothetical protein
LLNSVKVPRKETHGQSKEHKNCNAWKIHVA